MDRFIRKIGLFLMVLFPIGFVSCSNVSDTENIQEENQNWEVPEDFVFVEGTTIIGQLADSDVFVSIRHIEKDKDGRIIRDEIVHRKVVIDDFYICDHEVTQAEYKKIMGINPSSFTENTVVGEIDQKRPVENVSWKDAIYYCNRKSEIEGLTPCYGIYLEAVILNKSGTGYRLPTEVEWEYAARGGKDGIKNIQTKYSNSNIIDNVSWYYENTCVDDKKGEATEDLSNFEIHEVMKKEKNLLGLYDMSGSVWEWCFDFYGAITEKTPVTGPFDGYQRVNRGGSYLSKIKASGEVDGCKIKYRNSFNPKWHDNNLGFRVVLSCH